MTATAAPVSRNVTDVFNTLEALYKGQGGNLQHTYSPDATPAEKQALRTILARLDGEPDVQGLVDLMREYFNTYRVNGWRIVSWQVNTAVGLLARCERSVREHQAAMRSGSTAPGHSSPRCLTEDTDGECVCR